MTPYMFPDVHTWYSVRAAAVLVFTVHYSQYIERPPTDQGQPFKGHEVTMGFWTESTEEVNRKKNYINKT